MPSKLNKRIAAAVAVLAVLCTTDPNPTHWISDRGLTGAAEAGPARGAGAGGRGVGVAPGPGAGGAGVARRTTRRVVATGAYVATLPVGCQVAEVNGAPLYNCGGSYYQQTGGRYAVVTVN